ncbi:recombinase family protein, partial [Clostridium thermobutyricum]
IYPKWKKGEIKAVEAMELMGLKKNTFYNLIKRYKK